MVRLDIEDLDDPDTYAKRLINSGMAEEKARVYAYREFGHSVTETADLLDKDKGAVSRYYDSAIHERSDARKLTHYAYSPEYLSELPYGAGKHLDEHVEHTVAFTLHRPRTTDDGLSLEDCDVLEAVYIGDDAYLLTYYDGDKMSRRRGEPEYYTIDEEYIIRFIHDWVIPARCPRPQSGKTSHLAENFYLTDAFEPEWLESELAEVGVERVEVLTDERFTDPVDEAVEIHDSALTGVTVDGYRVGYSPTAREVAQRLVEGTLSELEAERITRRSPDELRSLV